MLTAGPRAPLLSMNIVRLSATDAAVAAWPLLHVPSSPGCTAAYCMKDSLLLCLGSAMRLVSSEHALMRL